MMYFTLNDLSDIYSSSDMPDNIYKWADSIMQYAGLLDKSGKPIYEGDVVEIKEDKFIIEYECCFFGLTPTKEILNDHYSLSLNHTQLEVIGNVYENPELLNNSKGNA